MLLIGRDLSPFVRRCAVSLAVLEIPVERAAYATTTDGDKIRKYNPLGRVPALQLDDGDVLIDSAAILDWLDEEVGPERALLPAKGKERRAALCVIALAVGAAEKAINAIYERNSRPEEKWHAPWQEKVEAQAAAGFAALDAAFEGRDWFDGQRMRQADITTACCYDFVNFMRPELANPERFPNLARLNAQCQSLPAFADTTLERFRS